MKGSPQRCGATTARGRPCSRQAVDGTLCTQHAKMSGVATHVVINPWDGLLLPAPASGNGARANARLRRRLIKGPRPNDPAGFIYVYYYAHEREAGFWKVGKTERTVEERLGEWKRSQGGDVSQLQLQEAFPVRRNVYYIERVIQMYLRYCNVHRYPIDGGFRSVWALDGQPVDNDAVVDNGAPPAVSKQVEWFHVPLDELLAVVRPLADKLPWQQQQRKKRDAGPAAPPSP
jgi:hypothetical protein